MRPQQGRERLGEASEISPKPAQSPSRDAQALDIAAVYEPTRRERAVIEALHSEMADKPPSPCLKIVDRGRVTKVSHDHPDEDVGTQLLMKALGTKDASFVEGLLTQITNASSIGHQSDEGGMNFILSVVKGIEPRDQTEAMLAAQMAATHMATMLFACRLAQVETIPQQDSAERAFNKLARTFTTQMEALKRYRTGGQQKVTVEHVTVNQGGQAIVGHVSHAPGGGSDQENWKTTS